MQVKRNLRKEEKGQMQGGRWLGPLQALPSSSLSRPLKSRNWSRESRRAARSAAIRARGASIGSAISRVSDGLLCAGRPERPDLPLNLQRLGLAADRYAAQLLAFNAGQRSGGRMRTRPNPRCRTFYTRVAELAMDAFPKDRACCSRRAAPGRRGIDGRCLGSGRIAARSRTKWRCGCDVPC